MKHYGKFLPFHGSPVKHHSNDLENLYARKSEFVRKLAQLEVEILERENEFYTSIVGDWTKEEIKEAKVKADAHNSLNIIY